MLKTLWESIQTAEVAIPPLEMLALLAVLTVCLLLRGARSGLVLAYLFVFRWGWLLFGQTLVGQHPVFLWAYCVFGFTVLILSVARMRYAADV